MTRGTIASAGGGVLLLFFTVWVSLSVGAADIPPGTVWKIVASRFMDGIPHEWSGAEEAIVWQVRMPRVALSVLAGMALAVAGTAFQGVLRNPLADPYVLGVSSGAAFCASTVLLFGWQAMWHGWMLPAAAFAGGVASLLIVFRMARIDGERQLETLLLSGVVVSSFFGAALAFVLSLAGDKLQMIIYWLMGSFAGADFRKVALLAPFVLACGLILLTFSRHLNVLMLGEREAAHLGMSLALVKLAVLGTASLLTSAAVAVSGTIGFVGLVVPHMVRRVVGSDYRRLLWHSALWGGTFLCACDTLARMAMEPRELPIGVLTAFVGAPFFAYLLRRHKQRMWQRKVGP